MQQSRAATPLLQNAKYAAALGDQMRQSEVWHVPAQDVRAAAHSVGCGRGADLVAFANQAHAEGCIVTNADFGHFQVTLLEYPQRQRAAGKQHCAEREYRHLACAAQLEPPVSCGSPEGADAPQRCINVCGIRSWSRTRATTKSIRSSTLVGW